MTDDPNRRGSDLELAWIKRALLKGCENELLDCKLAGAPAEKTAATGDYCRDCCEPVTGSVHVELVSGEKMCFRCFKRMG